MPGLRQSDGRYLEILAASPSLGVPIEVDVYDGASPSTMLATIENARDVGFGTQLSEAGAGRFTLNRHDPKATAEILADGNLVKIKVGGVYRFAYWIEEPEQVDVSMAEQSGEDRKLPGRGALAGLERARVYPPIWPTAAGIFRSATVHGNGAGATYLDVPKPAGAIASDIAIVVMTSAILRPSSQAGWARIRDTANGSIRQTTFMRRLGADEPPTWRFTWTVATAAIGQAVVLANATADVTQYAIAEAVGTGTAIKLPSVNVGVVDGVLLSFAAAAAATFITPPAGWYERSDYAGIGMTAEIATFTTPPVGDSGDQYATSGSNVDWIGMQLFIPSTGSTEAVFAGSTFGGILKTLIDQAQARGALPWLTYDFSGTVDSGNQPWPDTFELTFHIGTSLLDVWRHLVSLGLEGGMTPELKLRAFVDASRHFEERVIFRKGRHFVGDVSRAAHSSARATRVLVEGAGGRVIEVANPAAETDLRVGRREGFVEMTTSDDATTIQRAGEIALAVAELETKAIDLDVTHGTRAEGHYEPFEHYRDGDWISIDTDGDGTLEVVRIVATELEKTEGGFTVNLDANSIQMEASLRLQRKVDAIAGRGGGLGTTFGGGGGSGGGGGGASSGLVAVRPGDTAGYLADKLETDTTLTKTIVGEISSQRLRLAVAPGGTHPNLATHDALGLATDAELASHASAGHAPTTADYLVGTASGALSAEIVVGTTPGGELGGTWASPTVDATHSGSAHLALGATSSTAAAGDHSHALRTFTFFGG